ncbi:MAG: Nif3-like dinuclear metal center hexameric protein [Lawsonibacter sp.]|nr:Nif3-like dinuclear metal center hexameric protein [Lawsonibacter sp.]
MAAVADILRSLDRWAPFETQMDFDNSGFLVGRGRRGVKKILVTLDVTEEAAEEADQWGAELIVSHHPVIFHPVKAITDESVTGRILLRLLECGMAAICAHTNLDAAKGGVNDCLARALGLRQTELLVQDGLDREGRPYGVGRIGTSETPGLNAGAYAAFVKEALGAVSVRYVDAGRLVARVAVGGGACASMLSDAVKAGCDTFVTADIRYHEYLEAKALGINLMDAGHFATEQVVCPALVQFLSREFPSLEVRQSTVHREVYRQG